MFTCLVFIFLKFINTIGEEITLKNQLAEAL